MAWDTTIPSLLSRVRNADDHAAWRQFESRYGSLIVRYCLSLGVQLADAEDIRQLVFMGLSSALRSFQYDPKKGKFRTYLGRAIRNAVILVKKSPPGRILHLTDLGTGWLEEQPAESQADNEIDWEQVWREHHLRIAFRTLKRMHSRRIVEVFKRLLEGKSVNEVAIEFDMTVEGVKKIKQRVRTKLTEIIARQVDQESNDDA